MNHVRKDSNHSKPAGDALEADSRPPDSTSATDNAKPELSGSEVACYKGVANGAGSEPGVDNTGCLEEGIQLVIGRTFY